MSHTYCTKSVPFQHLLFADDGTVKLEHSSCENRSQNPDVALICSRRALTTSAMPLPWRASDLRVWPRTTGHGAETARRFRWLNDGWPHISKTSDKTSKYNSDLKRWISYGRSSHKSIIKSCLQAWWNSNVYSLCRNWLNVMTGSCNNSGKKFQLTGPDTSCEFHRLIYNSSNKQTTVNTTAKWNILYMCWHGDTTVITETTLVVKINEYWQKPLTKWRHNSPGSCLLRPTI